MILKPIKEGDIVEGDVRGQRFFARCTGKLMSGEITIESLNGKALGHYRLTARQVAGHYSKRKGSR